MRGQRTAPLRQIPQSVSTRRYFAAERLAFFCTILCAIIKMISRFLSSIGEKASATRARMELDGTAISWVSGGGSIARIFRSYRLGLCAVISMNHAESLI